MATLICVAVIMLLTRSKPAVKSSETTAVTPVEEVLVQPEIQPTQVQSAPAEPAVVETNQPVVTQYTTNNTLALTFKDFTLGAGSKTRVVSSNGK